MIDLLKTPHQKLLEEAGVNPDTPGLLKTPKQFLFEEAGMLPKFAEGGPSTRQMQAELIANGKTPPNFKDKAQALLEEANKTYPFIQRHNPAVIINENAGKGFAEAYPKGETGKPLEDGSFSRPAELPINRIGVEIYQPNHFSHHDLAGEVLHDDPFANHVRDQMSQMWSPEQLSNLKEMALDYQASLDEGQPEERAIQNATDSAIRGHVVKQWPQENNDKLQYRPEQMMLLNALQNYMATPPSKNNSN